MEYGCIGEKLSHSFSKEIHNSLTDYRYELKELEKDEVTAFMTEHNFKAINVTIPYKETVLQFLDYISEEAENIGAVNTIVNKNGKLYGYNTDFFGMKSLIEKAGIEIKNKTVAVLGSGGTSKTAQAVAEFFEAETVYKVSRQKSENFISYEELYNVSDSIDVIINTTPVGMFPEIYKSAVDVNKFENLSGVVDAVYNPIRSKLVVDALMNNVKAVGGLYMLVAQAAGAVEKFIDKEVTQNDIEKVFSKILNSKENIVLIGMPSSGKTTIGNILAEKLNRVFYDSDKLIEESEKMQISEIFKAKGEEYFRSCESEIIFNLSKINSSIISTGGGVVLNKKNIEFLKENGKIIFLDRALEKLVSTVDRPLSSTKADLQKRHNERYDLYKTYADVVIDANGNPEDVINKIFEVLQ